MLTNKRFNHNYEINQYVYHLHVIHNSMFVLGDIVKVHVNVTESNVCVFFLILLDDIYIYIV